MRAMPRTKRAAARVLRDAGRIIIHRGHSEVPAYRRLHVPRDGAPVDVATAMCLARFGVHPSIGWGHKQWRLMDPVYRCAYEALLEHLMHHHRSDVCGWNAHADRARDVIATLMGVGEHLHPGPRPLCHGQVTTMDRTRAWVAELERQVAAGLLTPVGLAAPAAGGHGPDWQDQLLTSIREHEYAGRAYQAGGAR